MSAAIVRKLVVFNVEDAHQRELLEWANASSTNFSGFVKSVLFAHKSAGGRTNSAEAFAAPALIDPDYGNIADIL
jgi:hypothetical protein